jgi:DNA-binding NarL/FixJ family response regulator
MAHMTGRAASRIRVLVADRHRAARVGERIALQAAEFDVVAECETAEAATAAARRHRPEVCLVDAGLTGGGLATTVAITSLSAATTVVMVAEAATPEDVLDALDAGAAGYLLKDVTAERLAQHVRDAAAGDLVISPPLLRPLLQRLRTREPGALTVREREVMRLLRMSLSTKQVAQRLGVAPSTVRRHASAAVRKLGATSRSDAIENGDGVHSGERQ